MRQVDLLRQLQAAQRERRELHQPVVAHVQEPELVQPDERAVLHLRDAVARQVQPEQVDQLLEHVGGDALDPDERKGYSIKFWYNTSVA